MGEIASMPMAEGMILTAKIATAMSRAAESQRKYEEPEYSPEPLTLEAITTLPLAEYGKIMNLVITALKEQMGGQTVEVEGQKDQKKTKGRERQESN